MRDFGWQLGLALVWLCMILPGTMISVIVFLLCGGRCWPRIFLLSVRIQLPFPPNSKLIFLIQVTKHAIYPQGFYTNFPLRMGLSVDYSVTVSASYCFNYCSFLIFSSLSKLSKILMVLVSMDILESTVSFSPHSAVILVGTSFWSCHLDTGEIDFFIMLGCLIHENDTSLLLQVFIYVI